MLVALLYALIYIAVIVGIAYIARWAVSDFLVPLSAQLATIVNVIIGLVAFVACILVLISVLSGGTPGLTLIR